MLLTPHTYATSLVQRTEEASRKGVAGTTVGVGVISFTGTEVGSVAGVLNGSVTVFGGIGTVTSVLGVRDSAGRTGSGTAFALDSSKGFEVVSFTVGRETGVSDFCFSSLTFFSSVSPCFAGTDETAFSACTLRSVFLVRLSSLNTFSMTRADSGDAPTMALTALSFLSLFWLCDLVTASAISRVITFSVVSSVAAFSGAAVF